MGKASGDKRGGYVGLFGARTKATVWISGYVTAETFTFAQERLQRMYRRVFGQWPARITKPDVVEYLLMGPELALARLEEVKAEREARIRVKR